MTAAKPSESRVERIAGAGLASGPQLWIVGLSARTRPAHHHADTHRTAE